MKFQLTNKTITYEQQPRINTVEEQSLIVGTQNNGKVKTFITLFSPIALEKDF